MSAKETPNVERSDETSLFDISIAIFAHIEVGGIGTILTAIIGKSRHFHWVVGLQDKSPLLILAQGPAYASARVPELHRA